MKYMNILMIKVEYYIMYFFSINKNFHYITMQNQEKTLGKEQGHEPKYVTTITILLLRKQMHANKIS